MRAGPLLTSDSHRAIQSEPRSPSSHPCKRRRENPSVKRPDVSVRSIVIFRRQIRQKIRILPRPFSRGVLPAIPLF